MKKWLLILVIITSNTIFAQRWFAINDSTSYSYQNTNITVGRHKVYRNTNNNLTLIRDFNINNSQISEDYIRDFDFVDEDSWYVLVGSRYIGQRTELYKTDDAGLTWQLVTPQSFTVSPNMNGIADSINQIQVLNGRIYLFDAYYISRVFYSDDLGQTWTHWFECFWSHYYQIFACGEDLFIHGIEGDGFRPYMVQIPPSFFGQQNIFTTNVGSCHNNTPGCYYALPNSTVPEVYTYFRNLFNNSICLLNSTENNTIQLSLSPNPARNIINIEGFNNSIPFKIEVYDVLGQIILTHFNQSSIDISSLKKGCYFVKINQNSQSKTIQFLKN